MRPRSCLACLHPVSRVQKDSAPAELNGTKGPRGVPQGQEGSGEPCIVEPRHSRLLHRLPPLATGIGDVGAAAAVHGARARRRRCRRPRCRRRRSWARAAGRLFPAESRTPNPTRCSHPGASWPPLRRAVLGVRECWARPLRPSGASLGLLGYCAPAPPSPARTSGTLPGRMAAHAPAQRHDVQRRGTGRPPSSGGQSTLKTRA